MYKETIVLVKSRRDGYYYYFNTVLDNGTLTMMGFNVSEKFRTEKEAEKIKTALNQH